MDIATILSTILFLGPGFFINLVEDQFWATTNKDKKYESYILESFIYSIIILVINLLFLTFKFEIELIKFNDLISELNNIIFFIKYILLTIISSFIVLAIKKILFEVILFIKNKNKSKNKNKVKQFTKYPTVWDKIFNNNKINVNELVFSISKGDVIISQGFLSSHSRLNAESKEIELFCTKDIADYLNDEKFVSENLEDIDFEYYDINNDVLIKGLRFKKGAFYNCEVEDVEEVV